MSKKVFRIYCEWDIGQDYVIFATEEAARNSIETDPNLQEIIANDGCTILDLFDEGLVSIQGVAFIE